MNTPEITSWKVVNKPCADMYDFRVFRAGFGARFDYHIDAKFGGTTVPYRLVDFTTSAPLNNALRDACINLVRCSA